MSAESTPTVDRAARAAAIVERRKARGQFVAEAAADVPDPEVEEFDPTVHNIDGVLAHLDEHPDDLVRVADLERAATKPRVTLLDELDARIEAATAPADDDDNQGDDDEGQGDDDA